MIQYKNSWSVKLIKRINSNRDEIWNLISSPKNLELYHPFCKSNNVDLTYTILPACRRFLFSL